MDLQGEAVGDALAENLDRGVRRGEHRGVLQEFGHEVGDVRDGRAGDGDAGQAAHLDALVVLDLGDGGAHDVHELDGLAPLPGGGGAGEDHQALGVAAHTGGQVVEAEQVGEFVGVLGPAFHGVEEGELLVQEDLAAAGEVDEDLGDAGAQFGLLDRGLDGGALEAVEGLADVADLVPVVLQARDLRLDVDLLAGGEAAHHAGQPYAGCLVGLHAQLPEIADEAAADAHGKDEREQQGEQAEDAGDGRLDDDAHRDRADAVLVAGARLVVEFAELVEDAAGGGVPRLGVDGAGPAGLGGDDGLFGDAQRSGGGVLPEALEAFTFGRRQVRQADLVHEGALCDEVGDVTCLVAGELSDHEGGTEQRVLAGEQLAGASDVEEGAGLLVHLHAVDPVEGSQQGVAGVDEPVVEVEGLGSGDRSVLDAAAQWVDAVEGVQDGGEALFVAFVHPVADVGVLGVLADLGDRGVGGAPGDAQRRQRVRGPGVGEIDERLTALLLENADGVLGGVTDLLDEGRHREQLGHTPPREYRGETPDRGQGHQRHEKQRHHLPADRLPAKAHGLPQLKPPPVRGAHLCVNSRREPTTDAQVTRRAIRNLNFRTGGETWGVVRPLREIAYRDHPTPGRREPAGFSGQLAGILSFPGIFRPRRSSFCTGNGGGMGHRSRILPLGGVKQRKPGSHWGAESSDTGKGSTGGGE